MDKICCIIDMEGFNLSGNFLTRELGWVNLVNGRSGSIRFDLRPYKHLITNNRDVDYVTQRVSGLTFEPMGGESTFPLTSLNSKILEIYNSCKTYDRNVVAFKGGNAEKDVLVSLGIPYRNLEDFGCPKFDDLGTSYGYGSCGYHVIGGHCPLMEVNAFRRWLLSRH